MDSRFEKINELFTNYSLGNFDYKIELTNQIDEIDAFISSINMLGEELRKTTVSRNYFNNIFNSVSDMLFVLDKNGRIEKFNKCVTSRLECLPGELESKFIDNFLGIGQRAFFSFMKEKLNKTPTGIEVEAQFKYSENMKIPVHCSGNFLYNDVGEKTGYLIISRDLSNIKKYEKSLRQSEEKYRKIFEETSDAMFVIDLNGRFLDLNKAGLSLFGYRSSEIKKVNYFELFNDKAESKSFLRLIEQKGAIVDYNTKFKDKENNIMECLISMNKIKRDEDNSIVYQGIIKNITKQKETENRIIRAIVDTQEQERVRFAKDIHDGLGQQLSAIKFYIETLNSSTSVISPEKYKAILAKSNEALKGVLADMRNMCYNLMPKTLENFGFTEAVNELCRKTEFSGLLNFKVTTDNNFPVLEKSLEIAIFRIIQEFINNSIKHSKAKTIRIILQHNSRQVKVVLKDNGVGFNVRKMDLFKGMGLKNVRSRIQSHNGQIKIESTINKGTQYKIAIPINRPKAISIKNKNSFDQ